MSEIIYIVFSFVLAFLGSTAVFHCLRKDDLATTIFLSIVSFVLIFCAGLPILMALFVVGLWFSVSKILENRESSNLKKESGCKNIKANG